MKMVIKNFKTARPVPGMSAGSYFVGKADISSIEMVEQGLLVRRERAGVEVAAPCIFTWANIDWYQGEVEQTTPKRTKKAASE